MSYIRLENELGIPKCRICQDLNDSYFDMFECKLVEQYIRGRDTGCKGCHLILAAVEAYKPGWLSASECALRQLNLKYVYVPYYKKLHIGLSNAGSLHDDNTFGSFEIFIKQDDTLYYQKPLELLSSLEIISDSSSPAAFSRALIWFDDCVKNHTSCKLPNPIFKPTRLINVGNENRRPHLFKTLAAVPYIALSYCWGPDLSGVLTTTKENLKSHLVEIDRSSLPKTLLDAMTVCKGIGIQNLWIDSLCIVQDDAEDWQRESGQMRQIYSNAQLTITADFPDSCKKGFLGPQIYGQPGWQIALSIDQDVNDHLTEKSFNYKDFFVRPDSSSSDPGNRSPLATRGWTLQESILPVRRLKYTGNELAWSCNTRTICECSHMNCESGGHLSWAKVVLGAAKNCDHDSSLRDLNIDWRALVKQYSLRKLTQESDKLSAISGIVQLINDTQNILGSTPNRYLAGIWENGLAFGMTWQTINTPEKVSTTRPTRYRAPTWSWASIDGGVYWEDWDPDGYDVQSSFELNECVCKPVSHLDPTGAVAEAHLIITGSLAPVQITERDPTDQRDRSFGMSVPQAQLRGKDLYPYEFYMDVPNNYKSESKYSCWNGGNCQGIDCKCSFDTSNIQFFGLHVCWMERFKRQKPGRKVNYGLTVHFLVLKRSESVTGAYERIGAGEASNFSDTKGVPFADATRVTIKLV